MRTQKLTSLILAIIVVTSAVYYFYPEPQLPPQTVIDTIIVRKDQHKMEVYSQNKLIKTYRVSLGRGEWGIKSSDWDNKTPIGDYIIDSKFTNSSFHKALTISYGNQIEIHGIRNHLGAIGKFHRLVDWTKGCIALTNREVDELYAAVPIGTTIHIYP